MTTGFITYAPIVHSQTVPDSKVHGVNIGPTWVLSAPAGPHFGPMNFAIRDVHNTLRCVAHVNFIEYTEWCGGCSVELFIAHMIIIMLFISWAMREGHIKRTPSWAHQHLSMQERNYFISCTFFEPFNDGPKYHRRIKTLNPICFVNILIQISLFSQLTLTTE